MLLKKRFVKLKNLCEQIRGVSYTPKDVRDTPADGYLPVLRANNIQDKITLDDLVYVNHKKIGAEQLLKEGDILICASSGSKKIVGKAVMVHNLTIQPASLGAFCKIVRPTKIYAPYLAHFFNSSYYRNTISHTALGANINNIRNEHINNFDIPYPDQTEQKRIAERLDKVQELIALQKEQLKKLDDLIKSRFIDLFGNPETNTKHWPLISWDSLFSVVTGKLDANAMEENGKYPFFTCAKESFRINSYAFDQKALLLAGNNATADYDVKFYEGKFNAYQRTYVISLKNEQCSYIVYKFLLEQKLQLMKRLSKGTNTRYLTLSILKDFKFLDLPIPQQTQFADFVAKIEKQKGLLATRLSHLETLYKSLMQEYFG